MTKNDLMNIIQSKIDKKNIIVISGASCSGKTTLASEIKQRFASVNPLVICQDRWFKDLEDMPKQNGYFNMECKDAFHGDEFCDDICRLFMYGDVYIPNYKIETNQRINKSEHIYQSDLTIIEGLHTVYFLKKMHVPAIYVIIDTDKEVCALRRAERDVKFIPASSDFIREHYLNVIYKNYELELQEQKNMMDNNDYIIGGVQ